MRFQRRSPMSHQCWRSEQRNSTWSKKGLFVVWESIGLLLGTTSFKSIQWSGTGGAQKGKLNTYQHCVTSYRSHMTYIRNPGLPVLKHLHRVKQGEFTCQNPKSSPTELKLAMKNLKQSPLFDSQRVMTRQSGRWEELCLHLFISINVGTKCTGLMVRTERPT